MTRPSTTTSATTATRCDGTCHPELATSSAAPANAPTVSNAATAVRWRSVDHDQHHHPGQTRTQRRQRMPATVLTRHRHRGRRRHRDQRGPGEPVTGGAALRISSPRRHHRRHDHDHRQCPRHRRGHPATRMPPQPQHNQLSPADQPRTEHTGHPPRDRLIHPLKLPLGLPRDRGRNVLGDRLKTLRGLSGQQPQRIPVENTGLVEGLLRIQRPRIRPAQLIGLLGVEHRPTLMPQSSLMRGIKSSTAAINATPAGNT